MLARKKPIGRSPSNLPLQDLVDFSDGSTQLYLGQQWLEPGDRVLDHTHPCEEILHFLDGSATVTVNGETIAVQGGDSVHIPSETLHGFVNAGNTRLHLLVIFPTPRFGETRIANTIHRKNDRA